MGTWNWQAKKQGWALTQTSHLYVHVWIMHMHVNHRVIKKGRWALTREYGTSDCTYQSGMKSSAYSLRCIACLPAPHTVTPYLRCVVRLVCEARRYWQQACTLWTENFQESNLCTGNYAVTMATASLSFITNENKSLLKCSNLLPRHIGRVRGHMWSASP